jgi:hypothetical protein
VGTAPWQTPDDGIAERTGNRTMPQNSTAAGHLRVKVKCQALQINADRDQIAAPSLL